MYVPGMAHYIYKKNKEKANSKINLHGIALGNGWADVVDQGRMVIDYAWWQVLVVYHCCDCISCVYLG